MEHFKAAIASTETTIKSGLLKHGGKYASYDFNLHSLQSEEDGYTKREIEYDDDMTPHLWVGRVTQRATTRQL